MQLRLKPVEDQVIVITGASSGIGLATAKAAARRGARSVLNSRDEEDLRRVAEEIRSVGGRVAYDVGDVADFAAMRRVADTAIREFGGFDTWVNNAGVSTYGRIEDVTLEDARRLFDTNYWGVVHGSLVALSHLKRTGGALINVGSILSETAYPLQGHYVASKHAVKGFTDSLRLEVEKEGAPVSITLIQPTAIDTPYPEHAKNYLDVEPKHMPPVYAPRVVANAILACAEYPRRNLRVGGAAKVFSVIEKLAPGVGDWTKEVGAFSGQRTSEPRRADDALHAPRPGDARVRGHHPGHVMQSSLYTQAALHPVGALLSVAAIGAGVALALRVRRSQA